MPKKSKRFRAIFEKSRAKKSYPLSEAIQLVKETSSAKFNESVEAHIKLGIDPKKSEQVVRGVANLPHGTGKKLRIAVFTESQQKEARDAGAFIVGGKELVEEIIKSKKIGFDAALATTDFMKEMTKIAKILGVKGLMPSTKNGTAVANASEAVNKLQKGQITFRNDDSGNLHQIVGKADWEAARIEENISALLGEIRKLRPKGVKGSFIQTITVCSTMGPGIKVQN
ncbi:MAG: 50S ribosomal protein L1 [Candidatus Jacksonbacteria bacterium]|nr:50S ribosomal protein L1 [Candidatus Jacksonbacteria bacterium]